MSRDNGDYKRKHGRSSDYERSGIGARSRLVTGTCHAQNPIFGRILGLGGNAVRPRDDGWRRREWLADM